MNKALSHLPDDKRHQITLIKDIILEHLPDVRLIILFGSYARGDWVEDTHTEGYTTHVYQSDFDILVATMTKKQTEDFKTQDQIENAIEATNQVHTPYNIIYHCISYVKNMVAEGHYFFSEITKEGVSIYHKNNIHRLAVIKVLTSEKRKSIAQQFFKEWFDSAEDFYVSYEFNFKRGKYKVAAFLLHQATERFYGAITLVFLNYRYRTHNLSKLEHKSISLDPQFAEVFPHETDQQRKAFNQLKKAYVDARYKPKYKITKDQLEYLAERVTILRDLTKKICPEKIKSFI